MEFVLFFFLVVALFFALRATRDNSNNQISNKTPEQSAKKEKELKLYESYLSQRHDEYQRRSLSLDEREAIIEDEISELFEKEKHLKELESQLISKYAQCQQSLDDRSRALDEREAGINTRVRQRVADVTLDLVHRDYISTTVVFSSLRTAPDASRFYSALTQDLKLIPPFDIHSQIIGASGDIYEVSLNSCTCKDFEIHRQPCKHMYRLAAEVGALLACDTASLEQRISSLLQEEKNLTFKISSATADLEKAKRDTSNVFNSLRDQMETLDIQKETVKKLANETAQTYPWLAKMYADYFYMQEAKLENHLRFKARPANKAADEVKAIRSELKLLRTQNKMNEYQLHVYETLFPWLEEFKELSPKEAYEAQLSVSGGSDAADEYEVLKSWLSPEEYRGLSTTEKYQLALDRYLNRSNKTKWEIGIEYERYIGYLCERNGYNVEYTGARFGLEDMGRDLILSDGSNRIVVQCKRWGKEKLIHEKHIFQLFGSSILLSAQNPGLSVKSAFVTTTALSDLARQCAAKLCISVYENVPFGSHPVIKCNIGKTGERIYHLPFDQQYDRVVISPDQGEFYAFTVKEAEASGFRRAYRWHGS